MLENYNHGGFRINIFKNHNVYHVSLLRPHIADAKVQPPPLPIFEEDELYEVK